LPVLLGANKIKIMHNILLNASCDAAIPWQFGFQDPASPIISGIIHLHNQLVIFLILTAFLVCGLLTRAIYLFYGVDVALCFRCRLCFFEAISFKQGIIFRNFLQPLESKVVPLASKVIEESGEVVVKTTLKDSL
jgi:Cytochrome C oxidase subunit II, transmembrane domain